MWSALCFDLDGTLASYQGEFDGLVEGLRIELGLMACDFGTFRSRLLAELAREGPLTLELGLRRVLAGLDLRDPGDLPEVAERAAASYAAEMALYPGAGELLAELTERAVPLALVSNGPLDMQLAALDGLALRPLFRTVLISGDARVAVRKPNRRIFELACADLGLPPAEVLMIGDDLEADIRGALAAGLPALRVGGSGGAGFGAVADLASLWERLLVSLSGEPS